MQEKNFNLSQSATKLFNQHMGAIRTGIANVSELRLRDNKPQSLSKAEFERLYIERVLGGAVGTVSADIRGLVDVLSKQAEAEVQGLADKLGYTSNEAEKPVAIVGGKPLYNANAADEGEDKNITPQGNENIKEDI